MTLDHKRIWYKWWGHSGLHLSTMGVPMGITASMIKTDLWQIEGDQIRNIYYFADGSSKDYGTCPLDWERWFKTEPVFHSYVLKIRVPPLANALTRLEEA